MRRKLWPTSLLALLVAALPACASTNIGGSGGGSKDFVFAAAGGSNQDAIAKACVIPFAKAHGLNPIEDTSRSLTKLKLMVSSNKVTWNVVYNGVPDPAAGDWSSLLTPLDYSVIDKSQILDGYASKYGVAHDLYSDVMVYNTKTMGSKTPTSWADLLDPAKKYGEIGVASVAYDGPIDLTQMAWAASTGSNKYPISTSAVTAKLNAVRPDLVYYDGAAQSQQLLTSGRVGAADMVASQAYELIDQGYPLQVVWNQNLSAPDWMEVPKGAPDQKLDMEFINYCLQKAPQLLYSQIHPNGPINKAAADSLPAKLAEELPSSPEHVAEAFPVNQTYWSTTITDQYTNVLQNIELG
jgi:putative spermidine/putrescine transport system substrate-binding protein